MSDLPIFLPGILLAYSAFFLGIATPGPNVLAVIGTSMTAGRSAGMAVALGVAAGSFSWAILTIMGLSALLAAYGPALAAIKIFGGCYLLFLAYKGFRSAASAQGSEAKELARQSRGMSGYVMAGYAICMTNPKALLAWIAIISLGLKANAPMWVGAVIVAGTAILSASIHCLYATAFSTPSVARVYFKSRRIIQTLLGIFFAMAGIRLLIGQV
jgi:threonine/homoserine/homoserine lactone efflux protein